MIKRKPFIGTMRVVLLLLLLCVVHLRPTWAKVVHGFLKTGDNWAFMSRFCFLSLHGQFQYEVQYHERLGVQNIDLYYDTPEQWARVYGRTSDLTTCRERESVLQVLYVLIKIIAILSFHASELVRNTS